MRLLSVVVALMAVQAASAFLEKFDEGWDARWTHSEDSKYAGRFKLASPIKGLKDKALKVGLGP